LLRLSGLFEGALLRAILHRAGVEKNRCRRPHQVVEYQRTRPPCDRMLRSPRPVGWPKKMG